MAAQKTLPSASDPADFIRAVGNDKRREDAERLLAIMTEVTGEPAVMWGASMIGFGAFHYRYASGHEGDTMKVGFSPRASALTLYGLQGHPQSADLLSRLGPHTLGKGCVYVKNLDAIDEEVLRELVAHGYAEADASFTAALP